MTAPPHHPRSAPEPEPEPERSSPLPAILVVVIMLVTVLVVIGSLRNGDDDVVTEPDSDDVTDEPDPVDPGDVEPDDEEEIDDAVTEGEEPEETEPAEPPEDEAEDDGDEPDPGDVDDPDDEEPDDDPEPDPDPDAGWVAGSPAPAERTEVGAAPLDGRIWVVGGFDSDGQATAGVLVYDPAADGWEAGPDLPAALHHAPMASDGDRLWVVGGYRGSGFDDPTDEVFVLDPTTGSWSEGPPLPEPRAAGAVAWDGVRLVYAGGVGPQGRSGEVLALTDDQWTVIGELGRAREHLAAASDGDGRVWFLAGRILGFDSNLGDVDLVEGSDVTTVGAVSRRGGVAGFYSPAVGACVAGGEGIRGTFAQVECIDEAGATIELPELSVARHGLGAAVVDGVAYTLLGGDEPGLFTTDVVEALDLEG